MVSMAFFEFYRYELIEPVVSQQNTTSTIPAEGPSLILDTVFVFIFFSPGRPASPLAGAFYSALSTLSALSAFFSAFFSTTFFSTFLPLAAFFSATLVAFLPSGLSLATFLGAGLPIFLSARLAYTNSYPSLMVSAIVFVLLTIDIYNR